MSVIPETLALLRPEELSTVWRLIDLLEHAGEMGPEESRLWRKAISGLMKRKALESRDLAGQS